jgi:hypothetical protein
VFFVVCRQTKKKKNKKKKLNRCSIDCLQFLASALPGIPVCGIAGISRAVININDNVCACACVVV